MTPTVEYVQNKIGEFNSLVFSSCLPPIPVRLSRARTFLGKVQYRQKRNLFGKVSENTDFVMRISTVFDLSEREQEDVILHEMIHYFIAYRGMKDTSTHGKLFRGYMEQINRNFGRNITVSHRTHPGVVNPKAGEIRQHFICVSQFQDDSWGVTVSARTRIFELHRLLPKRYRVRQMYWYLSTDPFFNRYPRSKTPKIYKITRQELDDHIGTARGMACDGRTLRSL